MTTVERATALLLQRALASLAQEATRREREAAYRPEGRAMWDERQVEYIREWCARS